MNDLIDIELHVGTREQRAQIAAALVEAGYAVRALPPTGVEYIGPGDGVRLIVENVREFKP